MEWAALQRDSTNRINFSISFVPVIHVVRVKLCFVYCMVASYWSYWWMITIGRVKEVADRQRSSTFAEKLLLKDGSWEETWVAKIFNVELAL